MSVEQRLIPPRRPLVRAVGPIRPRGAAKVRARCGRRKRPRRRRRRTRGPAPDGAPPCRRAPDLEIPVPGDCRVIPLDPPLAPPPYAAEAGPPTATRVSRRGGCHNRGGPGVLRV